jgi:hypothetical protein
LGPLVLGDELLPDRVPPIEGRNPQAR